MLASYETDPGPMTSRLQAGISLARYVKNSPGLMRILRPVASAYANAAGHRKVGLKYDDLIVEESADMQKVRDVVDDRQLS